MPRKRKPPANNPDDWSPARKAAWATFQADLDRYIEGYKKGLRAALREQRQDEEASSGARGDRKRGPPTP